MADISGATVTTGTSPSLSTDYAFVSIGGSATTPGTLRRMALGLLGQVIGFLQGGTGATARTMQEKIREMHISVMDYGAARGTGTSVPGAASDAAFNNALAWAANNASLCGTVYVPIGLFRLNSPLDIPPGVALVGAGRSLSELHFFHTTAAPAITLGQAAADHDITSTYVIRGLYVHYDGGATSTSIHGIKHTHTLAMDLCQFNNFPGCGMYIDTCWTSPTTGVATDYGPHYSRIEDCVFTQCDQYGCLVRYAAYSLTFINCQFSNNGINGFRQILDTGGSSTTVRGTTIIGGQSSYNVQQGYYISAGSGFSMYGAYAEVNWSPTRSNSGYSGGADDYYIGDSLTNSWVNMGVLFSASTTHVRLPTGAAWGTQTGGSTSNVQVWEGGRLGYGAT